MNLLISFAAVLLGGLSPHIPDARLGSVNTQLNALAKPWSDVSTLRIVEVHRSLSLLLHNRFSGGAGVSGSLELLPGMFFQLGIIENSVRPGAEAGITFAPFHLAVSPNLSVEAGHYFPADAASMLRALTRNSKLDCSLLQNFSHDFESGYVGLQIGSKSVILSLKGGFTHAELSNLHFRRVLEASARDPVAPLLNAKAVITSPSAKLGLTIRL